MKKILFAALLFGLVGTISVDAQRMSLDQLKEQKEINDYKRKKMVDVKVSKQAKKQAKELKKQGWLTSGSQPLEVQLDRERLMREDIDQNGESFYFFGSSNSTGENYDAAKLQAIELAKMQIANQLGAEISALVENKTGNKQLSAGQAASITQTVTECKSIINKKLGRTDIVLEYYRELPNSNKEVHIEISYSRQEAMEIAKSTIREQLDAKGDELGNQLDELLGW